jgi:hypothetical protein
MRKRHATVKNDVPTMEPNQSRRRCAPMGWQLTSGWGGRLPLDCMAALHGIGWQESSEYAGYRHNGMAVASGGCFASHFEASAECW